MSEKKVLVLGGAGFIGRNLVKYLVDNKLATFIRVADKSLPATSYLSAAHKAAFDQKDIVEFKQADLSKEPHVARAFSDHHFDYVVNLCGETRFGMAEADYDLKCKDTAKKCADAAAAHKIEKWVEISSAQVYAADKKASKEDAKLKPWTMQASARLAAEEIVKKAGLPVVTLRPAIVYGPGDVCGLTPRIIVAITYAKSEEKMKNLWSEGLGLNTVHVEDVCAAIWVACTKGADGTVYNLADSGSLTQGQLNGMLGAMFGIQTGFLGTTLSNFAKLQLSAVANEANDKHVPTWAKVCSEADPKIGFTPLSPYVDKELLYNNSLCIDGTKICKELDFAYKHPAATQELLTQQVKGFEDQGLLPKGWLKA